MTSMQPRLCFNVEKIIGVCLSDSNVRSYHVQWEPVWISSQYLIGCEELIEEFLQQQHEDAPRIQEKQVAQPRPQEHSENVGQQERLLPEQPPQQQQQQLQLEHPEQQQRQLQQQLQEQQQHQQLQQQHQHLQQEQLQGQKLQEKEWQQQQQQVQSNQPQQQQQLHQRQQQQYAKVELIDDEDDMDELITIVTPESPREQACEDLPSRQNTPNFVDHEDGSTCPLKNMVRYTPVEDNFNQSIATADFSDSDDDDGHLDTELETSSSVNWLNADISIYDTADHAPVEAENGNDQWLDTVEERSGPIQDVCPPVETVYVNTEEIVRRSKKTGRGYLCDLCGKIYTRRYGLKIHLRTHTGYKPLVCPHCSKPFADPSNMMKHMRVHGVGSKAYECPYCSKVLVRKRDLERHVKARHPLEQGSDGPDGVDNTDEMSCELVISKNEDVNGLRHKVSATPHMMTTVGSNQAIEYAAPEVI